MIMNVNGVGYGLTIPLSTYEKIVTQTEATLYVYTFHREDQLRLFGFFTEDERNLFVTLINISGIGPAMAISVLSGISIGRLAEAVRSDNAGLLTTIPGIGKAKAEKLVFELKRKLKKFRVPEAQPGETVSVNNDAVDALVTLGFDEARSSRIVEEIISRTPGLSLEIIIKEALRILSV